MISKSRIQIHQRRVSDGQDVANVAPIELVSPGFESGGRFFALDTWKLTRLDFTAEGGVVRVGLVKSFETNSGADGVATQFTLEPGEATVLSLLAAPSYEALSRLRFGQPRPVNGRMTFLYAKGWACAEATCNISDEAYARFAERLNGAYDLAILRSFEPSAAIAKAFRRNRIDPYYYMFLGAERRSLEDRFLHDDFLLRDANGRQYGAPIVSPTSSWGLYDIRRPEARASLVARAVSALAMGYRGIFFDGPAFWLASDGRVGGSAPGAAMSWTFARSLLLQETRAALSKADPNSRVGILCDRFYDAQALADFCLKESYAENWVSIDPNPTARILRNAPDINARWDRTYRKYTTNSLFIGQKGLNPLLIGAGLAWARAPRGRWFTEVGDAYKLGGGYDAALDRMGRALRDTSLFARSPRAAAIKALDPAGAAITTYGPSVLSAKTATTVTLDAPAPVFSLAQKSVEVTDKVRLGPQTPAIVAERRERDWRWTGYGFAYRDAMAYVYGDVLLNASPGEPTRGKLVLDLAESAAPLSQQSAWPEGFPARTVVFHLPPARALEIEGPDGARLDIKPEPVGGAGEYAITLPEAPLFANYRVTIEFEQ